MSLRFVVFIQLIEKNHYTNDLRHSILVLLISTAMLGLYIGTKLPFMNELMEGFNL